MPNYNLLVFDDFNRADTVVGIAGNTTAVGNGWIDVNGSCGYISGNKLAVKSTNTNTGRNTNFIRFGTTARRNVKFQGVIAAGDGSTAAHCVFFRQIISGNYAGEYLRLKITAAGVMTIDVVVPNDPADGQAHLGAVVTASASASFAYTAGVAYQVDFAPTGTLPLAGTAAVTRMDTSAVVASLAIATTSVADRDGQIPPGYFGLTTDDALNTVSYWDSVSFWEDTAVESGWALPDGMTTTSFTLRAKDFLKATSYRANIGGNWIGPQASPNFPVTGLTPNTAYNCYVEGSDGTNTVVSATRAITTLAASTDRRRTDIGHSWVAGTGASTTPMRMVEQATAYLAADDPARTYKNYNIGIGGAVLYNWTRGRENYAQARFSIQNNGCTAATIYFNVNDSNRTAAAMQTWYANLVDGLKADCPDLKFIVLMRTARTLDMAKLPAATCIAFNSAIDAVCATRPWCIAGGPTIYADFDANAIANPTPQNNPPDPALSWYSALDSIHPNDAGHPRAGYQYFLSLKSGYAAFDVPVTSGGGDRRLQFGFGLGL